MNTVPRRKPGCDHGRFISVWTALAAVASGVLLVLGGCATPGPASPPHVLLAAGDAGADGSSAHQPSTTPWPATRWWLSFNDPQLNALVQQALTAQPSLQSTQARLRQAQAALDVARGAREPQVSYSADITDQRYTKNGLIPPPLAGERLYSANTQLALGWELDLFGRQRAALNSAIGQERAALADTRAATVLTAGNTASAYFNLARLAEDRSVAQASLQQRQQVLDLVRQRVGAGLDTTVDLRQAEGLIAQSQVDIEALDEAIARARHALAEIAGLGPRALDALLPLLAPVRSTPLPGGLPADLLGRRADLVAQRWRVEAALRDVDVARAQFYPNVNLMAFVGLSSLGLDRFLQASSVTYGAGPALRLPIFDGGRLRANLSSRQAEVDAAIDAYNAALLRALREVADELTTLQSLERQQRAQNDATRAADAAFDLAVQRYRAGLGNFLTVLTAQTNVLAQRRLSTEMKARHLTSEVALARALGGGYQAGAEEMVGGSHPAGAAKTLSGAGEAGAQATLGDGSQPTGAGATRSRRHPAGVDDNVRGGSRSAASTTISPSIPGPHAAALASAIPSP